MLVLVYVSLPSSMFLFFLQKKKKKIEVEDAEFYFSFDSFSDIVCIFA